MTGPDCCSSALPLVLCCRALPRVASQEEEELDPLCVPETGPSPVIEPSNDMFMTGKESKNHQDHHPEGEG